MRRVMDWVLETRLSDDRILRGIENLFWDRSRYRPRTDKNAGEVLIKMLSPAQARGTTIRFSLHRRGQIVFVKCAGLEPKTEKNIMGALALKLDVSSWGPQHSEILTA